MIFGVHWFSDFPTRMAFLALSRSGLLMLTLSCLCWKLLLGQSDTHLLQKPQSRIADRTQSSASDISTIRTTVRRVVVDVVVRDSNNKPVHGLTARDFLVFDDERAQSILSFDIHNFDSQSISLPPNTPHLPTNNFVNIPKTPERGPLYVIFYDLVNMEVDDQIDARRQVLKFISGKPPGARFAIYVRSDGLYLVQGFTDDKEQLFAALDPQNPKSHVPRVFLMSHILGYGDPLSAMSALTQMTEFMDGLPGRKNLIWLAGTFPLALYPRKFERDYQDEIRAEIDGLTRAQVALYPINVRGVVTNPEGALTGGGPKMGVGGESVGVPPGSSAPSALADPNAGGALASAKTAGTGDSLTTDYMIQKDIAKVTGGRAFFSTNDVTGALAEATEVDGNYYSLSYSPPDQKDDGARHSIQVKLSQPGYQLSYRRFYYAAAPALQQPPTNDRVAEAPGTPSATDENDPLQPNMKHGAPTLHDLLFAAHVHVAGSPVRASPEQMSQLADEPAYFRTRHKDKPLKALSPVELQSYAIDYRVSDSILKSKTDRSGRRAAFEFAVAAFDGDGHMLNGTANDATEETSTQQAENGSGVFRVQQELNVPVNASWIRIGVRDKLTNRMGTIELQLPLTAEP
jgi:VWFA-related protein